MRLAIPGSAGRGSAAGEARPGPKPRSLGGAGRLVARAWRKSSVAGLAVYALALGGVIGLASSDWATRGGYPFGGVQVGAWTAWPRAGVAQADPYTRAVNARRGEIPLAVGEGLLLTASVDDQGQALDASCTYRIGGGTPPARAWTLTVAGRGPRDPGRPAVREGFTATEILRSADGRFTLVLAPDVQPGNWLPSPRASGPVRLALRLYDTPAAASVGSLDRDSVPAITRLGCAS